MVDLAEWLVPWGDWLTGWWVVFGCSVVELVGWLVGCLVAWWFSKWGNGGLID